MRSFRKIGFRLVAGLVALLSLNGARAGAGSMYSIVDLGAVANEGDGPRFLPGEAKGQGYVTDVAGRVVSEFDKTSSGVASAYRLPHGERVVADGNARGRFVGMEAFYERPKRPEPGQVAIDLVVLHEHAALANKNLTHWTDLHNLFRKKGWDLQAADKIDDRGRIEGQGTLNGVTHDYLLIPRGVRSSRAFPEAQGVPAAQGVSGAVALPVPEPATLAWFALTAGMLARRSFRRGGAMS